MLKWNSIVNASSTFLQGTDEAFNFRNMLIVGCSIKLDTQSSEVGVKGFEFTVHEEFRDLKTTLLVEGSHCLDGCEESGHLLVGNHFNRREMNMTRDSDEKWDFVDKHDITTEGYILILCHDVSREVVSRNGNRCGSTAHSFTLQTTKIRSKNCLGHESITSRDRTVRQLILIKNHKELL